MLLNKQGCPARTLTLYSHGQPVRRLTPGEARRYWELIAPGYPENQGIVPGKEFGVAGVVYAI